MINIVYFLIKKGGYKKNKVKKLVNTNKVFVNDIVVDDIKYNLLYDDTVVIGRHKYVYLPEKIVLLNKPKGYECSKNPISNKSVYDLVDNGLIMVGRLDADTTGLLVFREDGSKANKMLLPMSNKKKVYEVTLRDKLTPEQKNKLENDMIFKNGVKVKASEVKVLDSKKIELTICEGKFHQIKIMLMEVGNKSCAIHRIKFDVYDILDLKEGQCITLHE